MTIDISPEMQQKVAEAAAQNLEAGDWVAEDPFLDINDPPPPPKKIRRPEPKQ